MNKLLIHNNNTSFNRANIFSIAEQFVFDIENDKDVDLYIDDNLSRGVLKQKIESADIIFIKIALSENYLEYLGLRLAYHIRLTKTLGAKTNIPIIFIAEESLQFLGLTYAEPTILFTKGIYLIKEKLENYFKVIKWFDEGNLNECDDRIRFINTININPPANYQSHHSIANEWALTRYFDVFEKDDENEVYTALKKKILNLDYLKTLHYKYTEAKASRQKFKKPSFNPIINGIENTQIGIIDDEINKGWLTFYDYLFCRSQAKSLAFYDFKKYESKNELILRLKNWLLQVIDSNYPIDLFIIDLRLHDDDFGEVDFDNITGIQIIKFIKKKNPGIQIVISTASNKVWNYQKCLEYGVTNYAIKESPETFNSREETKSALIHFKNQITNASGKIFLALLFRNIKTIKEENIFVNLENEKEFQKIIFNKNGLLDQIFNLISLDLTSETILNQVLLLSFQILELYCDLHTVGSFGSNKKAKQSSGFIWLKNGKQQDIFISKPPEVMSLFELKKGTFDFQTDIDREQPSSIKKYEKLTLYINKPTGTEASTLIKLIAVLHYRESLPIEEIDRLMMLRFYRSNVSAHLTGEVDLTKFKIKQDDISFFISIFNKIFLNASHVLNTKILS